MATGWEIVPETANALSAPVTKLVEVIAAGCGRLYRPTDIRRTARAEGDALVIMEEAKQRASEVATRAAQRLIDVEERRQTNLENITSQAEKLLPPEVSPDPVDNDWTARFFAECQDVGNEQMQSAWARLLVGEIAKPGSFSQRTLQVLRNLSTNEAQQFNTLCTVSFRGSHKKEFYPMFFDEHHDYWDSIGIDFMTLQNLESAGLLTNQAFGVGRTGSGQFTHFLRGTDISILAISDGKNIPIGKVVLTAVGAELAEICEWHVPPERVDAVADMLSKTLRVQTGRVHNINLDTGDGNWEIINDRSPIANVGQP